MKHESNKIYIIIPVYNEEKNLYRVLENLLKFDYQIVVIDDGSNDRTYQISKSFSNCPGLTVLRHRLNRGQGAALQTGTEYALNDGAEIIVHFDGDGQFLSEEINYLVKPILCQEADVVLGSRFHTKQTQIKRQNSTKNRIPFFKKNIILPIAKITNQFLTGIKLTDAHCGFRAMNKMAAEKIKITQDKMSHNTEIVSQIKKYNLKYKEVPVTVIYHEFGQGIGGGFKILKELLFNKLIN